MNYRDCKPYRVPIQRAYLNDRPLNNRPRKGQAKREFHRVSEWYLVPWENLRPARQKRLIKLQRYIERSRSGR